MANPLDPNSVPYFPDPATGERLYDPYTAMRLYPLPAPPSADPWQLMGSQGGSAAWDQYFRQNAAWETALMNQMRHVRPDFFHVDTQTGSKYPVARPAPYAGPYIMPTQSNALDQGQGQQPSFWQMLWQLIGLGNG